MGVHDVFEHCVRQSPSATAVVAVDGELSYAELDALANRLAHRLADLGVRPGSHVGVCLEPSLALAVALLGVLKAGAAFVPLDPQYPAQRLAHLIADSGADIAITDGALAGRVPLDGSRLLRLDSSWASIADAPTVRPTLEVPADGVACVIYTSGSTGLPKGVLITHRGLVNLASAAAGEFGLRPGDRFLQLASIGFSASLEEIFPSLLIGGTLVLAGYRQALPTVERFVENLRQQRITGFEITTAHWHQLVDEIGAAGIALPASIRFVVVGGDPARADAVLAWRKTGIVLINVYGPTEATATGSYHNTRKEIADECGLLPIGRAIANTELHLLDATMTPVRPGEVGDIYIGGASLARGYHGAAAKTAEVFVPDPFDARGGRLYRTGDLGRMLPDGTVEFMGRADNQIKIRGVRIEPGEIEAVLQRHDKVGSAVVSVSDGGLEDRYLVAHVTAGGGEPADEAELRVYLSAILPSPMIPARFITLDDLPLTVHGKVDRDALRLLAAQPMRPSNGFEPPRLGTETELAALWSEVLKRDQIGRNDDFFALGGNSLQAVRIVSKARRWFGVEVAANDLLTKPTVADCAARIEALLLGSSVPAAADDNAEMNHWRARRQLVEKAMTVRTGAPRSSPAAVSQQNLWLLSKFQPYIPLYNEAWQCRLRGALDSAALRQAFASITRRHETWRTRFVTVDGQPVQVVSDEVEVPLSFWDLSGIEPSRRLSEAYAIRDELVRIPLDPANPPLVKVWVFPLAADDHLLVFNLHHIIWDGISKEAFLDEFVEFYEAYRAGSEPKPAELPLQYGDFALWQRSYLSGPPGQRLLDYWRAQLADERSPLPLPFDHPVPPVPNYAGAKLAMPLPARLREKIIEVARQENVTPFMVLFTALCHQLHRSTGALDLCVGTPMANRLRPGIDALFGCFINSIPLRVKLSDGISFRAALDRVRATCVDALAHQELPFDRLVEELRPARYPGRSPVFQVWFATEDHTLLPRESPGLSIGDFADLSTGLDTGVAKLDLNWIVVDRGDQYLLTLTYRTSLFDEPTALAMIDQFRAGLEQLVEDPASGFASTAAAPALTQ